jgi:hypothetical protein
MPVPSTIVVLVLVAFVIGTVFGYASCRLHRGLDLTPVVRPDPIAAYLTTHAVRLALAQHWARGGILSNESEPWRPVCTAAAVAALLVDDDKELSDLLGAMLSDVASHDPQVVNVWRQARAELVASLSDLPLQLVSGRRQDGSPDWNRTELRVRARTLLDSAHLVAIGLAAARSTPPPPIVTSQGTQEP